MRNVAYALLLLGLWGCAPIAPLVDPAMVARGRARDATIDAATLEQGRSIYVAKCASCHALPAPDAHPVERWPDLAHRMARRAKLDESSERTMLAYVLAAHR